jgi:glutamate racemase
MPAPADVDAPLGIFDSGVGGLTVMRGIMSRLPGESILYLGDTARVPYGTKSEETVIRYALGCARVLVGRGIKLLVVACNTASAFAVDALREELGIPVLGVIEPGAHRAVQTSRSGCIGVIGTAGTIRSGRYQAAIQSLAARSRVVSKPCPLFVPLAEEGWTHGAVPRAVAHEYLDELLAQRIDTLVLGCTHYPLLSDVIAEAAGPGVALVDSAEATADAVAGALAAMGGARKPPAPEQYQFLVTDDPAGFGRIGRRFLGRDLGSIEWVDVA